MALVDSDYSDVMSAWDRLTTGPPPGTQPPATPTPPTPAAVQESALVVNKVDLQVKQNSIAHRTKRYELVHLNPPQAVLRRGEPFTISISFNDRAFNLEKDLVRVIFDFGTNPIAVKGTKGITSITETHDECWPDLSGMWDSKLLSASDVDPLIIQVRSPADVPVGVWKMHVETSIKSEENGSPRVFTYPDPIYILFNPWLKEDLVYMEDKSLLDEYVLNDVGKIWVGPERSGRGRQWVFGQFDKNVLPSAMLMLERAHLVPINRGNPIILSRAISKMVNAQDDQGILYGRWDGEYKDGTAPGAWTGSVEIMKAYLRTGNHVKYGQCWVFAGVTTTICRALGLPSRVVSNLVSAHDTNASLTIDKYYTKTGEEMPADPHNESGGEDSIWNFHVWNEAWMARPDLPKGYGGWQAIDATPQETSDGIFQCGPSSLEAIKNGMVGYKYDVPFVLSSVNADLIRWQEDPTSALGFRKMDTNTRHVGRMLITKKPFVFDFKGDTDMENITDLYKSNEGTKMERTAMYNAVRGSTTARKFFFQPGESEEELSFELEDLERVPIGHSFTIVVNIKNNQNKARKLDVVLSASSVYYNGINAHLVKKASGTFQIKANSNEQLRLVVTPDDYLDKLVEYCIMKIFAVITVPETKQTWANEDDFQITKPKLEVKAPEKAIVGQPIDLEFSFKNPLNKLLKKCKLRFEGPGLSKAVIVDCKDVQPEESVILKSTLTPLRKGKHPLIAVFSSRELIDITGSGTIEVEKAA